MVDTPKTVVQTFIDAVANGRELRRLGELLSDDFYLPVGDARLDRDGLASVLSYYFAAFPDLHYEVKDIVADTGTVATRVLITGTHDGAAYAGRPATGRSFAVYEMDLFRVVGGRIASYEIVWDELGFRRQLGLPLDA